MIIAAPPSYIQFYPTLSCNFDCGFCFNRYLKPVRDVTVNNFEKMLSTLSRLEIPGIDILGGEPTLHHDFLTISDLVVKYGLKANISSNGTNVPMLKILSEKYDRASVNIGISINSHVLAKPLHKYILSFRPVLKSIFDRRGEIAEAGKPYIGLPGIDYFLLYMDVVDRDDLKNSMPFYAYFRKLADIKMNRRGIDGVFCAGFIPDTVNYPILESVRCPAGTTKLSVMSDGSVYPCYLFFRYKEFELGNILRDGFDEIWQHPVLDYFRRFDINQCPKTGCELFASCHGGCPAMSYHFYKDLQGPDPRCMQGPSYG
jgi:radical SAM protein with 4Fe4S-binding SPASM domain